MKLFSRTDSGTVRKTLEIYRDEAKSDKRIVWTFSLLIPLSHFLYIVLLPLLISFVVQSLIENPHNTSTPFMLIGAIIGSGILSLLIQHYAFISFF